MNTLDPSPGGEFTLGSSLRRSPLASNSGAMIGLVGNPNGDLTVSIEDRFSNEERDESIACESGAR